MLLSLSLSQFIIDSVERETVADVKRRHAALIKEDVNAELCMLLDGKVIRKADMPRKRKELTRELEERHREELQAHIENLEDEDELDSEGDNFF